MQVNANYSTQAIQSANSAGKSTNTQEYLQTLREKFPDLSITIQSFNSHSAEAGYAFGRMGTFNNVAISKNILEQMANDPKVAAKYEEWIGGFPEWAQQLDKIFTDGGYELLATGTTINKDGKIDTWCIGRKIKQPGDDKPTGIQLRKKAMDEMLEKKAGENREKKIEEERELSEKRLRGEDNKPHFVRAESMNALMQKLSALHDERKNGASIDLKA
ncbi:MAG: DUF6033 family protein [Oscillospiraceae bacterium]|nr:DUF6033 family protein [Oscillospiraceae bacterium]